MHKTFTTIALVAMLGALAVGCQKENIIDEPPRCCGKRHRVHGELRR